MEELEGNKDTAWRVGENDWWQNKHYDKCEEVFDKYLTDTTASVAPWYIIDSGDKKWAELQVLETLWPCRMRALLCQLGRRYSRW